MGKRVFKLCKKEKNKMNATIDISKNERVLCGLEELKVRSQNRKGRYDLRHSPSNSDLKIANENTKDLHKVQFKAF